VPYNTNRSRRMPVDARPLLALALVIAAGCTAEAEQSAPVSEIQQSVVGGQEANACQFPAAGMVLLSGGLCTGTLVHPKLVIFAAHCQLAGSVRSIYFGENATTPARKVDVQSCNFYPSFKANVNDVAYCVLKEEIKDIPIAPVLMGCETNVLQKGRMVDMVGFGITSMKQPRSYGIKRWASVPLLNTPTATTNIAQVGNSTSNGCEGDSGGPIYVRLDDGTWRTAGVASTTAVDTTDPECIYPTNYVLVNRWIDWIEQDSGVDITPCHDADGTWNPSAECGHFATTTDATTGSWDTGCNAPGAVSAQGAMTCGPAYGTVTSDAGARRDGRADGGPEGGGVIAPRSDGTGTAPAHDGGGEDSTPTLGLPNSYHGGCSYAMAGVTEGRLWLLLVAATVLTIRRRRR
jgi:hypothetical protein